MEQKARDIVDQLLLYFYQGNDVELKREMGGSIESANTIVLAWLEEGNGANLDAPNCAGLYIWEVFFGTAK